MTLTPWYEYWYYIAGICSPIITAIGLIFIWLQVSAARKQAKSAELQAKAGTTAAEQSKKQLELMNDQLRIEIETRRAAALPFFSLTWGSSSVSGIQPIRQFYEVRLTNCGNVPAFIIKLEILFPSDEHGNYIRRTIAKYDAVSALSTVQPGISSENEVFILHLEFTTIYEETYYQEWSFHGNNGRLTISPKIIETTPA